MLTWTEQELNDIINLAFEILNKKKHLQVKLKKYWIEPEYGHNNFNIVYYHGSVDKESHFFVASGILEVDDGIVIDRLANLRNIKDPKLKITLRIAYYVFEDYKRVLKRVNWRDFEDDYEY